MICPSLAALLLTARQLRGVMTPDAGRDSRMRLMLALGGGANKSS